MFDKCCSSVYCYAYILAFEPHVFLEMLTFVHLILLESTKKLRKPKPWKHTQPITRTELKQMRDEFWDTAPHYGGQKGDSSHFSELVC